jgi:hypothetical protein
MFQSPVLFASFNLEMWDILRAKRRAKKAEMSRSAEQAGSMSANENYSRPSRTILHSANGTSSVETISSAAAPPSYSVNNSDLTLQSPPVPPRVLRQQQRESILHYLPPLSTSCREAQSRQVFQQYN